ncbi:hypothetical protein [Paenibacillus sp. MMS18-CY102]|uniref:hypothetical protein n=1 Tax=Paenibacillus sp. MMS18-CY102 TaxID=2682849 RepID=UPI001365B532|nr:hypothetical protein [Paenibacillus sp. MMS18-CY102]MWC29302.1 hypothetical protein [Paenibacillus sp. MMS18-CY102]
MLRKATLEDQVTLQHMLQLYTYDFTEFTEADIDSNGLYPIMPDFGLYWTEPQSYSRQVGAIPARKECARPEVLDKSYF